MMSDVLRVFLTPLPPLIPYYPISGHTPILWCPILTLRPLILMSLYTKILYGMFPKFDMVFLSQKCHSKFSCKVSIKRCIMSTHWGNLFSGKKEILIRKKVKKLWNLWDVRFLLNYLPPLSYFVRFCLTP